MSATDAEILAMCAGAWEAIALGVVGSSVTPTYAAVADVRDGVDRGDGTLGTLDLPVVADVRDGTTFDGATKTGELDLPAIADVRDGVQFDSLSKTGALDLPAVADVRSGVEFDGESKSGLLDLPAVADVRSGVAFDRTTQTGSAAIPAASDVRAGVAVDAGEGNLALPLESKVLDGVGYGSNETEAEGNVTLPDVADVLAGETFGPEGALTGTLASPAAPGLSVVSDGTGSSATATVTGAAGATITLYYKRDDDASWTTGASLVGPGSISQTGLSGELYTFFAVAAVDGLVSLPSNAVRVNVAAASAADPIQERVAQAIADKLEELVTSGDATDVIRPLRGGKLPPRKDGQIILVQEDPVLDPKPPAGFTQWIQLFGADLIVIPSDTSDTPVDTLVNRLRGKVEAKLRSDPQFASTTLKGAVVDTVIRDPMSFDPAERVDGVRVQFTVIFRHRRNDPFSFT